MTQEQTYRIDSTDAFTKRYRMRKAVAGAKTITTTLPSQVIEREAKRRGITTEEFLDCYEVEFLFNGVPGAFLRFVRVK